MPLAVRTVGGTTPYQQTYTLGPQERFRLDSVNFSIPFSSDGQVLDPTLRIASTSGQTIAEVTGTQEDILGPPGFSTFGYTGPAVMTDDFMWQPPNGYIGYLLHDFGAAVIPSKLTVTQPVAAFNRASMAVTWLRSPGAVTMSAGVGETFATLTNTVTVTLTAPVAAGDYLLLDVAMLSATPFVSSGSFGDIAVTDSVGGNLLDFSGFTDIGFSFVSRDAGRGLTVTTFMDFYRVVNPLPAGATVTVTLNHAQTLWLGVRAHDVTGLTVGNPIGPNPGGNIIGFGATLGASPTVVPGPLTPNWTGAVIISGLYFLLATNTLDVCMARGQTYFAQPLTGIFGPGPDFTQVALPELHLEPNDTLTVLALDQDGSLRVGDVISDFLIYGVDE